ncbi:MULTISPECIES: site-specific recombinase [unclassified Pseudomonas]|uniref:site-specific recombinase n=1 Tax=unclassified Pseudomonas TaxID=196821 RepID=UPI000C86D625|nr:MULTISPECIES: site-specific recombinase [unclassified Pseudomonas]PMU27183.1 site-specific recombinase [Pseudomonas sp. GP01-A9]PMU27191.1 site-specific recombinase [Pseudomonas sp. GP01-A9]PMU31164.1 site-specific recombinase [Pseudomonas sp. GP01-A13]PMU44475.1 site-specific recombinase [Pseudomonas sp. GP01-A8]PMU44483.1 site-specific recombinase [Pseudomonas sp. GP01-A8]
MAKSADQKQATPPSSLPAYVFRGPAYVAIRTRTNDQPRYVDTRQKVWTWYDGGIALKIDWSAIQLNSELIEIGKGFMAYALEKYAPRTAVMFADTIRFLPGTNLAAGLPWATHQLITALGEIKKTRAVLVGFRRFYRWAMDRGINGFDPVTYLKIKEVKSDRVDPYARIFLSQSGLELDEEIRLLKRIERELKYDSWVDVQFNIVLHLGFEIAPRSIQFHSLEIADFEFTESDDHEKYYTLWLPMAKKLGQRRPERRPRKITTRLGEKISRHVSEIQRRFGSDCEPLFVNPCGRRLSIIEIGTGLKYELREAGIDRPNQVTMLLRHHLGQGLADQGTPADMIAELLGHNSTVAARAYVTATPNIARIKEKALGKSPAYQRIMRSLLTGEIVQRRDTAPERAVRGVIDTQYIGDIGACALPVHTHCPYNPIYACYTCKKFHPFADGRHEQVKDALQREAQRFIDMAELAGDLIHNRPMAQHQTTILAVSATIERCRQQAGDAADDAL